MHAGIAKSGRPYLYMGALSAFTKKTLSHQVFQGPCPSSILRAEHTHNLDRDSEVAILQSMGELETCFPFAMEQSVSSGLPLTRTQV